MKKCIICLLMVLTLMLPTLVFADAVKKPYFAAFTADVYYCDHSGAKIVLKNISPVVDNETTKAMATVAEYNELSITKDGLRLSDGTKIELDWINNYADGKVWFVMMSDESDNLFVPYLKIM